VIVWQNVFTVCRLCGKSAVNKRVQSIQPTDQSVENITSYTECEAGICPVYVFLLNSRQKWGSLRCW